MLEGHSGGCSFPFSNCICDKLKSKGVKYDEAKLDFTLLPKQALDEVVKVLMYGAKKYPEPDNWKRVPDAYNRYIRANLRHSLEAVDDEIDPESNLYHLAHAVCCDLFALHFALEKKKRQGEEI